MAMSSSALRTRLANLGVEYFAEDGAYISDRALFEAPCAPKGLAIFHGFELGAFSYGVSGFCSEVRIGRYCSFGEAIQIGRGAHPTAWMSTSPFFYAYNGGMFNIGTEFKESEEYHRFRPSLPGIIPIKNSRTINDFLKPTVIGNDVWIGHGAFIAQGVMIGNGAVVAGASVVTKDVPPYAIVGGNPAQVLKMRFTTDQFCRLEKLAWWRFAPWQLKDISYGNIDDALDQLEERIPSLVPFVATSVKMSDIINSCNNTNGSAE